MNILITICARGGSKGIKNKNIRVLNNKPLLDYTIVIARNFAQLYNADIQLSTDSQRILDTAKNSGYHTPYIRPERLATDTIGKVEVIRDAWTFAEKHNNKKYDIILDLDVSSPMRTIEDLKKAFHMISNHKDAINLFSVNKSHKNPYFNMVEESENGYVKLVKTGNAVKSRQMAPKVYDMNASFYFYKREFMESGLSSSITTKSLIYIMSHLCFDLDTEMDFIIMELLFKQKLIDFKL